MKEKIPDPQIEDDEGVTETGLYPPLDTKRGKEVITDDPVPVQDATFTFPIIIKSELLQLLSGVISEPGSNSMEDPDPNVKFLFEPAAKLSLAFFLTINRIGPKHERSKLASISNDVAVVPSPIYIIPPIQFKGEVPHTNVLVFLVAAIVHHCAFIFTEKANNIIIVEKNFNGFTDGGVFLGVLKSDLSIVVFSFLNVGRGNPYSKIDSFKIPVSLERNWLYFIGL